MEIWRWEGQEGRKSIVGVEDGRVENNAARHSWFWKEANDVTPPMQAPN